MKTQLKILTTEGFRNLDSIQKKKTNPIQPLQKEQPEIQIVLEETIPRYRARINQTIHHEATIIDLIIIIIHKLDPIIRPVVIEKPTVQVDLVHQDLRPVEVNLQAEEDEINNSF